MDNKNHPEAIFIQLNTFCNANCINCPFEITYRKVHKNGTMSDSTWNKILSDIIEMDFRGQVGFYLHFEPLIEKSIFKKINDINSKTNAHVVLSTNAGLLTEEKARQLVDAKPRRVHINLNSGIKEEYERSMSLDFETTIKNARYFIDLAKGKIELEINCPVMEGFNVESLRTIFPDVQVNTEYWANSRGGLLPDLIHFEEDKGSRFKLDNYCTQPSQNFNILYDGSTLVCCNDWMHESKNDYKNVHDSSILEIYSEIKKLEYKFKKGDYSKYKMCQTCSKEMGFFQNENGEKLNILLTNHHLSGFTGSENLTYTLAKELSKLGHLVTVYSKYLNLKNIEGFTKNVRFIDNLESVKNELFDIAHVHHNIAAIEIRNCFENLPIVFLSQGVVPFLEQPSIFNIGISKYLALSEEIKANLIKHNINEEKIEIVRNLIDIEKFISDTKPQSIPTTALVISRNIDAQKEKTIINACKKLNISTEFIGGRFGEISQNELKEKINSVDLVFSLGRGALEAMIANKAVIVFDHYGGDGMVLPETYAEIRKNNFSGRRFAHNYSVSDLINEIKKYNIGKIEKVSKLVRQDYSSENISRQLISIYKNVIKEHSEIEILQITKLHLKEINSIIRETIIANTGNIWQNIIIPERENKENRLLEIIEELIQRNEISAAKFILTKVLEEYPTNTKFLNDLAVVEIMTENFEQAVDVLLRILKIDPFDEVAIENMNYLQSLTNKI